METRKRSAHLPNGSKKRSPRHSELGKEIISGMEELRSHFRGEIQLRARVVNIPDLIDVQAVRLKLGISQVEFASRYGFSLRTLQEWEQGRSSPESAVRAYLTVIDRNPQAVVEALASGSA